MIETTSIDCWTRCRWCEAPARANKALFTACELLRRKCCRAPDVQVYCRQKRICVNTHVVFARREPWRGPKMKFTFRLLSATTSASCVVRPAAGPEPVAEPEEV